MSGPVRYPEPRLPHFSMDLSHPVGPVPSMRSASVLRKVRTIHTQNRMATSHLHHLARSVHRLHNVRHRPLSRRSWSTVHPSWFCAKQMHLPPIALLPGPAVPRGSPPALPALSEHRPSTSGLVVAASPPTWHVLSGVEARSLGRCCMWPLTGPSSTLSPCRLSPLLSPLPAAWCPP